MILFQLVSSDEGTINLMDRVQWCGNNSPRAGISPRFPGRFNSIRAVSPPLDTRVVFLMLPYLIKLTEACPAGCLLARHYVITWTLTSTFSCFQCYRLFQCTVSTDHKRFMTYVHADTGSMIESKLLALSCTYVILHFKDVPRLNALPSMQMLHNGLGQCFSTAGPRLGTGPWHQL